MTEAQKFLSAIMDMATGVLDQHGHYDDETQSSHGPGDHIGIAGSVLDNTVRTSLVDGSAPIRSGYVDTMFDNEQEGVVLSVMLQGSDGYDLDIFIPLTATVVEVHSIIKPALNKYVEDHFG